MKRTEIRELFASPESFGGKEITVCGWVKSIRDQKSLAFIQLSDGGTHLPLQVVMFDSISNYKEIAGQNVGAALIVHGVFKLTPEAKQPFEVEATAIEVEGPSTPDYPLQKKRHTLEYLRTLPHLRMRTNTLSATFRVRSVTAYAIHKFFNERGFVYAHTPIITTSDCEGAGEMFRVTTLDLNDLPRLEDGSIDFSQDFFGASTALTVSGQLQGETMAQTFGKIYTFGPTFRAEESYTARHASEFWMIEPEIAFADLQDDMDLARDMVKYILSYVMEHCPQEMQFFNDFFDKGLLERIQHVIDSDFATVTYTEAIEQLEKVKDQFQYPVFWGADLQTEHERYLTEQIYKKPLFVINYPKELKAFYMRVNDDNKTVAAVDLLVPGVGEIIGGSQREERPDVLEKRIEECGLNKADYEWYLDLRRYGTTHHAGFGLGFERMIMYMTGMANIRDILPFPRTPKNAML